MLLRFDARFTIARSSRIQIRAVTPRSFARSCAHTSDSPANAKLARERPASGASRSASSARRTGKKIVFGAHSKCGTTWIACRFGLRARSVEDFGATR